MFIDEAKKERENGVGRGGVNHIGGSGSMMTRGRVVKSVAFQRETRIRARIIQGFLESRNERTNATRS